MRRLEEMFWPTKAQAIRRIIGWTIFAFAVPIACSAMGDQSAWGFFWLFIPPAIYAALVLWYKVSRDQRIKSKAVAQRVIAPSDGYGEPAPKTTPGSGRIFLPTSLPPDERV